jgi:polar amino acid transport system substrate-binding protein
MYKTFVSLFALLIIFSSSLAAAERQLIATGNPEAPPIVWEKSGKLIGIGPQLAANILGELGTAYTIQVAGTWEEVQNKAREGSIDLIVSAYDNSKRRQYMDFSAPYLESPVVIVVKRGDVFPFTSWKDLTGKKGVANTGESFGEKFDTYIQTKLTVNYVPYKRAFEMLAEDTADYLIMDLYPAIIYSKLLLVENDVEFLKRPATIQYFHMAMSKKSPFIHLLPEISKRLQILQEEGTTKKMAVTQYKQWNAAFIERKRFFAQSQAKAQQEQVDYDARKGDMGMDNLIRFIERDAPYLDGVEQ